MEVKPEWRPEGAGELGRLSWRSCGVYERNLSDPEGRDGGGRALRRGGSEGWVPLIAVLAFAEALP